MGPSGIGKTTLFHIIAGLDATFDGERRFYLGGALKPVKIGFCFQDRRVLPWLTAEQNIAFALLSQAGEAASLDALSHSSAVEAVLEAVNLLARRTFYPRQLSGGQIARVALARALVGEPDVVILDEPLSGLDRPARLEMFELIETLQKRLGFLQILISHQADEAIALSDKVLLMGGVPATIKGEMEVGLGSERHWLNADFFNRVRELEVKIAEQ